ncbi:hypothetical protein PR048_014897 [Dryococelus australis]|uniref:TBC1 domain family member 22B n=1 Tax=Dryococelus australis TaxID=614101 RepID=A0ABQ9HG97_9NEOP|nr:hypothetical protein PR048_014897 [Dryococelus australis]
MERLVVQYVVRGMNNRNCLEESQHGFRRGYSCETQLAGLLEDLVQVVDEGKQASTCFIAFEKAFDKVPFGILMRKVEALIPDRRVVEWIGDFLRGRRQRVKVGEAKSEEEEVTSGVPQGSVLGALLFTIMINDMCLVIRGKIRLFVDCVVYTEEGLVGEGGAEICRRTLTRYDYGSEVRKKVISRNIYKWEGQEMEEAAEYKYLGIVLQGDLRWKKQVERVFAKGRRTLGTMVWPMLEYAATVWDPYMEVEVRELEKVQRSSTKWVKGKWRRQGQEEDDEEGNCNPSVMMKVMGMYSVVNEEGGWGGLHYKQSTGVFRGRGNKSEKLQRVWRRTEWDRQSMLVRSVGEWNVLREELVSVRRFGKFRNEVEKELDPKVSFWKKNVRAVPGRPSPTKDSKTSRQRGTGSSTSYQDFQESVSDAWDMGDDEFCVVSDVSVKISKKLAHSAALSVINSHRHTSGEDGVSKKTEAMQRLATQKTSPPSATELNIPSSPLYRQYPGKPHLMKGQKLHKEKTKEGTVIEMNKLERFLPLFDMPLLNLDELKDLSWSGVPGKVRAITWRLLSGYLPANTERRAQVLEQKRQDYWNLVKQYYDTDRDEAYQDTYRQIHIDIPRMSPLIALFQQKIVQEMFERILYIWAIRHPASGYVQGMNDLVTPFYVVFLQEVVSEEADLDNCDMSLLTKEQRDVIEADSFWCLSKFLEEIQDNYIFAQLGIQQKVNQLKELIQRIDAPLHRHIQGHDVDYLQFSFRWMNNLLTRELPLRCTIRLWDTYLAESDGFASFQLYVCAAFLLFWRRKLLLERDFQGLMLLLQNLPTQNWGDSEISMLVAEAYRLKFTFADAPNHLQIEGARIAWPACSPVLTPLDYFLWDYMKGFIYEIPVESEEDLLVRIMAPVDLGLPGRDAIITSDRAIAWVWEPRIRDSPSTRHEKQTVLSLGCKNFTLTEMEDNESDTVSVEGTPCLSDADSLEQEHVGGENVRLEIVALQDKVKEVVMGQSSHVAKTEELCDCFDRLEWMRFPVPRKIRRKHCYVTNKCTQHTEAEYVAAKRNFELKSNEIGGKLNELNERLIAINSRERKRDTIPLSEISES